MSDRGSVRSLHAAGMHVRSAGRLGTPVRAAGIGFSIRFLKVAVVYVAVLMVSMALLGSPAAIVLGIGVAALPLFLSIQASVMVLVVSAMVDIPMVHVIGTESLALRISDVLLGGLMLRLLLAAVLNRGDRPPVPRPYRGLLGFWIASLAISALIAISGGLGSYGVGRSFLANALVAGGREIAYLWMLPVAWWYFRDRDAAQDVLEIVFFAAAAAAIVLLLQFAGLIPPLWEQLPSAWMPNARQRARPDIVGSFAINHAHAGIVLAFGFLIGLALLLQRIGRRPMLLMLLAEAGIFLALVASRKRAAYVTVIIGVITIIALRSGGRVGFRQIAAVAALALGLVVTAVAFDTVSVVQEEFQEELDESFSGARLTPDLGGRLVRWTASLEYLRSNPGSLVLGSGLTFDTQIGSATDMIGRRGGSHNQWLGLVVERGIIGLLAVVLLLLALIRDATARIGRVGWVGVLRVTLLGFTAGAVPFSMASYVFTERSSSGSFPLLFFLVAGLMVTVARGVMGPTAADFDAPRRGQGGDQ